jgi:hypothetical protein
VGPATGANEKIANFDSAAPLRWAYIIFQGASQISALVEGSSLLTFIAQTHDCQEATISISIRIELNDVPDGELMQTGHELGVTQESP